MEFTLSDWEEEEEEAADGLSLSSSLPVPALDDTTTTKATTTTTTRATRTTTTAKSKGKNDGSATKTSPTPSTAESKEPKEPKEDDWLTRRRASVAKSARKTREKRKKEYEELKTDNQNLLAERERMLREIDELSRKLETAKETTVLIENEILKASLEHHKQFIRECMSNLTATDFNARKRLAREESEFSLALAMRVLVSSQARKNWRTSQSNVFGDDVVLNNTVKIAFEPRADGSISLRTDVIVFPAMAFSLAASAASTWSVPPISSGRETTTDEECEIVRDIYLLPWRHAETNGEVMVNFTGEITPLHDFDLIQTNEELENDPERRNIQVQRVKEKMSENVYRDWYFMMSTGVRDFARSTLLMNHPDFQPKCLTSSNATTTTTGGQDENSDGGGGGASKRSRSTTTSTLVNTTGVVKCFYGTRTLTRLSIGPPPDFASDLEAGRQVERIYNTAMEAVFVFREEGYYHLVSVLDLPPNFHILAIGGPADFVDAEKRNPSQIFTSVVGRYVNLLQRTLLATSMTNGAADWASASSSSSSSSSAKNGPRDELD